MVTSLMVTGFAFLVELMVSIMVIKVTFLVCFVMVLFQVLELLLVVQVMEALKQTHFYIKNKMYNNYKTILTLQKE